MPEAAAPPRSVVLLHQGDVLHYRVAIYNRLSSHLRERGWRLVVVAGAVQRDSPHPVSFELRCCRPAVRAVLGALVSLRPDAVIFFVNLKETYLFPALLRCKLAGVPAIYWGHAIDLEHKGALVKNLLYRLEHRLFDALVLYADWLRRFVSPRHQHKTFIANNTIDTALLPTHALDKDAWRARLGVKARRTVIFVGRIQRRKRVDLLIEAFGRLTDPDVGLLLVGPDTDGLMADVDDPRVTWVGPRYGEELAACMQLADVYCMPGHVGLSIVDAMVYGLPFVTTDVDHAPEIMYLKDGETGFVVPAGAVDALADRLRQLLDDPALRERMGRRAREVIRSEGSLETMFRGFDEALAYVMHDERPATGAAADAHSAAIAHGPTPADLMPREASGAPVRALRDAVFLTWKAECFRSAATARTFGARLFMLGRSGRISTLRKVFGYAGLAVRTLALLRRERPRAVLCINQPPMLPLLCLLYARSASAAFAMDFHSGALTHAQWRPFRLLYRAMVRRSSFTLSHNAADAVVLRGWGGDVALLPTLPQELPGRDALRRPGRPLFVFVCSFADDEPLDEALAAFGRCPQFDVVVTGRPRRAAALLPALGPNVSFSGFLPYADYLALLTASTAVVTLSRRANIMQMAVEEAISLGVPVVTNRSATLAWALEDAAVFVDLEAASIADGLVRADATYDALRPRAQALRARRWADVAHETAALAARHAAWFDLPTEPARPSAATHG